MVSVVIEPGVTLAVPATIPTAKQWAALKYGDFELQVAEFDRHPGELALVISGDDMLLPDQEEILRAAGFRKFRGPSTVWARQGASLKMRELRPAFPEITAIPLDINSTRLRLRGVSPFSSKPPLPLEGEEEAEQPPEVIAVRKQKINDFQVAYAPASRLGKPIAVIPIHLAEPTAAALREVERVYGPVDDFVASRLDVTVYELAKMLSCEQIDAVALGIATTENDRDLLLADQTGLGKGRILAALALAAVIAGKNVVFITEKANLFSDFWRDIQDIGADKKFGAPFLLNSKSRIKDVTSLNGDVLFEALPDAQLNKIIRGQELPSGYRIMFSTYSQYNKKDSAKGKFLKAVATDGYAIKDEAHNAAGKDSNTGDNVDDGLEFAWGVARSSATFATEAFNLLRYRRALPPSWRTETARELLASAGNSLAEVLAQALAEDGVLVRREQDLSGIDIKLEIDEKNVGRNRVYQDRLAPILRRMARLQRSVESLIDVRNEEAEAAGGKSAKEKWYTSNFGSRLSLIRRQFLTALSVDHCVERCIGSLLAGEKPVVVVEATMESLMRDLAGEKTYDNVEDPDDVPDSAIPDTTDTPPDFPAALRLMLDRIMQMSVKRGKDTDAEKVPVDDPYCQRDADAIREMLEDFPQLSLSPIDDIKDKVEAEGRRLFAAGVIEKPWQMGEISARSMRVQDGRYEVIPKVDRNDIIVRFNNGTYDGMILTGAGSTGLSLHASERVIDQRVRRMIELQIARNVRQRVQFWGRVDRRGQVVLPKFEVLSTGLLTHTRILIMENNKVRAMYANVSANAETGKAMDDVPDLINSIGNAVAQRILEDRPKLAESMSIGMRGIDQETADQELYYINKLLGRFDLISTEEAEKVFDQLLVDFADEVAAYAAKGRTIRGVRELDGVWREVSRRIYEDGDPADGAVFGRAVEIVVMEGEFEREAITAEKIQSLLRSSRERLGTDCGNAAGPFFEKQVSDIRKRRTAVLTASMGGRYISVSTALKDKDHNSVKAADERLERLMKMASILQPGISLTVPAEDGETAIGVIVDVRAPDDMDIHHPGRWSVKYAVPGEAHAKEVSIATLMRDKAYELHHSRSGEAQRPDLRPFDLARRGLVTESREFLTGNLVKSVAIAMETSSGSMVTFEKPDGSRERSVLVSRKGRRALFNRAAKTTDPIDAQSILDEGRTLFSDVNNRLAGLILEQQPKGYLLSIPARGKRFKEDSFRPFCQSFRDDRNMLSSRVMPEKIQDLLDEIFSQGVALHYEGIRIDNPAAAPARPGNRFGGGKPTTGKGFASRR